jgi:hypothetical protein
MIKDEETVKKEIDDRFTVSKVLLFLHPTFNDEAFVNNLIQDYTNEEIFHAIKIRIQQREIFDIINNNEMLSTYFNDILLTSIEENNNESKLNSIPC